MKGILELDIKGKTCKVDYNMMLGGDFPRSAPFVRIINRNPDYKVDPYYLSLQSKNDKASFVLNEKLNACKSWHQSSSLVRFELFRSILLLRAMMCLKQGFLSISQLRILEEVEGAIMLGINSTTKLIIIIRIMEVEGSTIPDKIIITGDREVQVSGDRPINGEATKIHGEIRINGVVNPVKEEWEV